MQKQTIKKGKSKPLRKNETAKRKILPKVEKQIARRCDYKQEQAFLSALPAQRPDQRSGPPRFPSRPMSSPTETASFWG